jgi:hypothetical protein
MLIVHLSIVLVACVLVSVALPSSSFRGLNFKFGFNAGSKDMLH